MRPANFLVMLALAGLVLPAVQPVYAQTNDKKFNQLRTDSQCEQAVPAYPFTETGYPFKVSRLRHALAATGLGSLDTVSVAVFDNDFIGYDVVDTDDNSPIRASRNFPREFFVGKGETFTPYYDRNTPPRVNEHHDTSDLSAGHGTGIVGIILGGKYDDDAEPDATGIDIAKPSVRALLTESDMAAASGITNPKVWLNVRFVPVAYDDDESNSTDPATALSEFFELTDGAKTIDIVNMSFGRRITDARPIKLGSAVKNALIVAAAGNSKDEMFVNGVTANPISADGKGIMLAVASVDTDGELSSFSNLGKGVSLAAPGCAIKSWIDGDTPAQALSGTSMATALVSFTAALVRARWNSGYNVGFSLRNRLIASARYNSALTKGQGRCNTASNFDCVQDGNMLDMEAAVLVNRDFIEYRTCTGTGELHQCVVRTAIGNFVASPRSVSACTITNILPTARYGQTGLSFNGAIKRRADGSFLIYYEPAASIGMAEVKTEPCPGVATDADKFVFTPKGIQLDGSTAPADKLELLSDEVLRIVVRATK